MEEDRWSKYYKEVAGRNPRKLLIEALQYASVGSALDAGAGDLVDSDYLLQKGFEVDAFDNSIASATFAKMRTDKNFHFFKNSFTDFQYNTQKYDLISAQLSLPFSTPVAFNSFFPKMLSSLKLGGIFTGHFFGVNDEWNDGASDMTFSTLSEIQKYFEKFKIIKLLEEEVDMPTASGVDKHWHTFSVIAHKE